MSLTDLLPEEHIDRLNLLKERFRLRAAIGAQNSAIALLKTHLGDITSSVAEKGRLHELRRLDLIERLNRIELRLAQSETNSPPIAHSK